MRERVNKSFLILIATVIGGLGAVVGGAALLAQHTASAAETVHVAVAAPAPAATPSAMEQQFQSQIRPFLKTNCFKCHGDGKHKGDVALDKFTTLASVQQDLDTWQTVHDELEQHDMPPEKAPQPSADQMAIALKFTSLVLDDPSKPKDPGFVPIHRLNRNEYNNTIRDLVGVDFHPADDFPADDTGYGFDNIADVLSMSPLLAEKYLGAAEQVMDKAIVLENPFKPKVTHYVADKMSGGEMASGGERGLYSEGEITQEHHFITKAQYEFRIEASQDQAGTEAAKLRLMVAGKEIKTFDVSNRRGRTKVYTVRTEVEEGTHTIGFDFTNDFYDPNAANPKRRDRNLYITSVEIEGPFDVPPPPPSDIQKRLLFCGPADGSTGDLCASQIIRGFATRAFRRPATDDEVARLLTLYRGGRSQGESFEAACKFALTAVLVSPQFLYRIESDPARSIASHPLSDFELASRLSYFLWSSMPDDLLLDLAGKKKLHEPAVLGAQVRRMLADAKSQAFVRNFAGQWLELRNLSQVSPDPKKFPQFDQTLREDMQQEGERYFQAMVHDDRSALDLLDSNYTFLNARLAKFYGIEGVEGDEFRKVQFNGDQAKRRGGVLTMAAVLTVSALPNRTSPVKRGKFILDQILGTPPPPPPPGVPALVEKGEAAAATTVRERLEQHRANPACAACHAKLDPLGFALENFDAIGRWRDKDNNMPIDNTGSLPSGEAIAGPAGLRQVLIAHKDQFLKAFVSKLMTYALGRGTTQADGAMIRQIYKQAEANDCRFSTIMDGIVRSDAFLKRRAKT
jgi:mono/diheme cytochrome c family protein